MFIRTCVQVNSIRKYNESALLDCLQGELSDGCVNDDGCLGGSDLEGEGKQVLVGICAMAKKSQSKPMKEILTRLEEFEYIKIVVFAEEVILKVCTIYFQLLSRKIYNPTFLTKKVLVVIKNESVALSISS